MGFVNGSILHPKLMETSGDTRDAGKGPSGDGVGCTALFGSLCRGALHLGRHRDTGGRSFLCRVLADIDKSWR